VDLKDVDLNEVTAFITALTALLVAIRELIAKIREWMPGRRARPAPSPDPGSPAPPTASRSGPRLRGVSILVGVVALVTAVAILVGRPFPPPCGEVLREAVVASADGWQTEALGWQPGRGWSAERLDAFLVRCGTVIDETQQATVKNAHDAARETAQGPWVPPTALMRRRLDAVRGALEASCE